MAQVEGCDLDCVLDKMKCKVFSIQAQSLNKMETLSLVKAMKNGVTCVILGSLMNGDTKFDIKAFQEYDGSGECNSVTLWQECRNTYSYAMKKWAKKVNWTITSDSEEDGLELERL